MDETPIETPAKPTRKRKYVKADIVLWVGRTRVPADSFSFTDKFLVVKYGKTTTYFALAGLSTFKVEDRRKEPESRAISLLPDPISPNEAGGPKALAAELSRMAGRPVPVSPIEG